MKRMYQLIAAAIVTLLVPLAASMPVSAAATCDVGYTGPNSQNMCTSVQTYDCTVENNNIITIDNTSTQVGVSGAALNNSNTVSGGATSGTVTNGNGTVFSVVITNGTATTQDPKTCSAAVVIPATTTPETVVPTVKETPKALPVTSGDSTLSVLATTVGITGVVALVTAGAAVVHRRFHS